MKSKATLSDKPRILSVGQCGFDGAGIERILNENFDAEVTTAGDTRGALDAIRDNRFDLVLVNRLFDANGESGLELIKKLQTREETKSIPVMLVSNYADAQQAAIELGARPGFGKNALHAAQTLERLRTALARTGPDHSIGSSPANRPAGDEPRVPR